MSERSRDLSDMEGNVKLAFLPLMFLLTLLFLSSASPDEATGKVTHVVDGDTFDVQLQTHDNRITEDLIRIRLADIDCPETRGPKASEAGRKATDYTLSWMLNNLVFLDLDDKTGKDQYGRWDAVVYLTNSNGSINISRNFNKMLVDSGNAVIEDFRNSEFDPHRWWSRTQERMHAKMFIVIGARFSALLRHRTEIIPVPIPLPLQPSFPPPGLSHLPPIFLGQLENCPIPGDRYGVTVFMRIEGHNDLHTTQGEYVAVSPGHLNATIHCVPIQWLFKMSYTRATYPSTRDNKSSRCTHATAKYTFTFYHFNLQNSPSLYVTYSH